MDKTRLALAALGFVVGAAQAHDGGFVDTFGVHGREQIGFAPSLGLAVGFVDFVDIALQPDAKIIVSAAVANTGSDDIGVLRLNPNGTLDTNFGTQGQTIVGFDGGGTNTDGASSVLLQPNGRIVVCGIASGDPATNGTDFGIVRLTSSGAPDTQFSGDGKATVGIDIGPAGSRDDLAVRCSLQADGKIVVAGQAQVDTDHARMAVARLNSDGSRDTGFNGSGTATIDFGPANSNSLAFSVKSLDNGGTLLIGGAGADSVYTFSSWAFARLDAGGQLDASFGNGGIALFDPGFPGYIPVEALDAVVLPDNSFVGVGIMALLPGMTNSDVGIFKLTANGNLDTSFGSNGGQIVPFDLGGSMSDLAVKVLRDAQGRFLVVGFGSTSDSSFTTLLIRLTATGELDPSFGVGGKLTVASAPPPDPDLGDTGTSVALTPDGGILVASAANATSSPSGVYAGLAKLVGDTIFDGGFDPE
ncbi:MAG TPA: delta-60 repeat domain-containing protein [Rhodanobacteraceae bacterium]|nr:delta-60 repeat domain-containing protein [Rhodanobacteraceae bacterium]